MKYDIHSDFRMAVNMPFNKTLLKMSRAPMKLMGRLMTPPKGVRVIHEKLALQTGEIIDTDIFEPVNSPEALPCLLYFHGGGFGYDAAPNQITLAGIYAKYARCRVVLPHYHLLPEYPYPAAKHDALDTFDRICRDHERLRIDPLRIAAGGDSAGAVLAAYVCNEKGRTGISPCFQLLVYPVTNAAMNTPSMEKFTGTPLWNSVNNRKMWDMYLNGQAVPLEEYSPMQMKLPEKIPDTYIETAEYDCLHDEGTEYALRLRHHGGKVLLRETHGTIHGYDLFLDSPVVKQNVSYRIRALRNAFK